MYFYLYFGISTQLKKYIIKVTSIIFPKDFNSVFSVVSILYCRGNVIIRCTLYAATDTLRIQLCFQVGSVIFGCNCNFFLRSIISLISCRTQLISSLQMLMSCDQNQSLTLNGILRLFHFLKT